MCITINLSPARRARVYVMKKDFIYLNSFGSTGEWRPVEGVQFPIHSLFIPREWVDEVIIRNGHVLPVGVYITPEGRIVSLENE